MRIVTLLLALVITGLAAPAISQTAASPPRVGVIVVTLDQVRQIQTRYGRSTLTALGRDRWGRFAFVEPGIEAALFDPCLDDRPEGRLDYCVRFYLTRAELAPDAAPTVVVVLDDRPSGVPANKGSGEMRAICFGRGVVPADAAAQDIWLWPGAARMHGIRDLTRDNDAMAACISAAASEPFAGLRQPDID